MLFISHQPQVFSHSSPNGLGQWAHQLRARVLKRVTAEQNRVSASQKKVGKVGLGINVAFIESLPCTISLAQTFMCIH